MATPCDPSSLPTSTPAPTTPSLLPKWTELARACGRTLANPRSPRVSAALREVYGTPAQMHAGVWWSLQWAYSHGPETVPALPIRNDILEALFHFCGTRPGQPWELRLPEGVYGRRLRAEDPLCLRLDTPFGEAFLRFLGDRPLWLFRSYGELRNPTAEEARRMVHGSAKSG